MIIERDNGSVFYINDKQISRAQLFDEDLLIYLVGEEDYRSFYNLSESEISLIKEEIKGINK